MWAVYSLPVPPNKKRMFFERTEQRWGKMCLHRAGKQLASFVIPLGPSFPWSH